MPEQVTVERTIHADANGLYELVSDLPRMGEWSPENTGGKWVNGATGPAVGAHFKGTNRNGVRKWSTNVVITVAKPGEQFTFDVTIGPLKVSTWDYRFGAAGDGTKVVQTWTDRRSLLVSKVAVVVAGVRDRPGRNRENMEATLAKLAAAVED